MEQDLITKFLGNVDKYRAARERYKRPLTEKTVSIYLFGNSRRIPRLREGADIGYKTLTRAQKRLGEMHAEFLRELV